MYGAGNLGDDLLMASVTSVIGAGEARVTVAAHSRDDVRRLTSCHAVPAPALSRRFVQDLAAFTSELKRSDVLVVGGGGLFQDTHYWFTVAQYALPIALATLLGKRVVVWGVGIGPFRARWNRWLTRAALALPADVRLRDPDSVRALGAGAPDYPVVADAVWWLEPGRGLGRERAPSRPLGLILREWPGLEVEALVRCVAALAHRRATPVLLVPFEYSTSSPRDWGLAERVQAGLARLGVAAEIPLPSGYPELPAAVAAIASCGAVLTMRFHGALLALRARVPVAAVSCSPKISQLMENGSLGERVVSLEAIARGSAVDVLDRMLEDRDRAVQEQEPARTAYLSRAGDGENLRVSIRDDGKPGLARRLGAAAVAGASGAALTAAAARIALSRALARMRA
jgi:polysaccharide pyruvyl transferase CsaB